MRKEKAVTNLFTAQIVRAQKYKSEMRKLSRYSKSITLTWLFNFQNSILTLNFKKSESKKKHPQNLQGYKYQNSVYVK